MTEPQHPLVVVPWKSLTLDTMFNLKPLMQRPSQQCLACEPVRASRVELKGLLLRRRALQHERVGIDFSSLLRRGCSRSKRCRHLRVGHDRH